MRLLGGIECRYVALFKARLRDIEPPLVENQMKQKMEMTWKLGVCGG